MIFHLLCFWALLRTVDSWLGKLSVRFLQILSLSRSCSLSGDPRGMSFDSDMTIDRFFFSKKFWWIDHFGHELMCRAAMWRILGNFSTEIPSALHLLCPTFCIKMNSYHQLYPECVFPISSQVLLCAIRLNEFASMLNRLCLFRAHTTHGKSFLVSTAVLTNIVSRCVLSRSGTLRWRMCLADSESISRRTETLLWSSRGILLYKKWDWLQSASNFGCTLLRSVHRNDIPWHSGVLPNRHPIWVTTTKRDPANLFEPNRALQKENKCVACFGGFRINCFTARLLSVVVLKTCVESCLMANCMSRLQDVMKMNFPTAVRKLE